VFLHTITDACTPVCLFAAITSVEAVTPPYVKRTAINLTLPARAQKSIRASIWLDARRRNGDSGGIVSCDLRTSDALTRSQGGEPEGRMRLVAANFR